jgi:uncharacterized membrane protein
METAVAPLLYGLVKWLHVLLAVAALGATATYGIWIRRSARSPEHLAHVLRTVTFIDDRMTLPAYLLVLVTGAILMGLEPALRVPPPWLLISIALYVVALALAAGMARPALRRQIEAAERAGADSEAYRLAAAQQRQLMAIVVVLVAVIVFLMVNKPNFGLAAARL